MHSITNFLKLYNIDTGIIFTAFFITVLLYLHQLYKASSLLGRKKKLLDISSNLIDHPIIFFSNHYEVMHANDHIQEFFPKKRGESIKEMATQPFVRIEDEWKSLTELLEIYKQKSTNNILYLSNVYIKNKPVNIRISSSNTRQRKHYFGLAIFDIADKFEPAKVYYQNTTTGLPNHNKAIADIGLMAHKAHLPNKKFAIAIISIDHLLEIISVIGYSQSLDMISAVAKYLQESSIKNNLHLYHMTGDNFLLILPEAEDTEASSGLINQCKADCEQLLHKKNTNLHFSISAGISIYPDNSIENLLNSAYQALSLANKQGLGYTVVAEADHTDKKESATIAFSEIQKALETEEFVLYYQPIYNVADNTIPAAEALIRWIHPTKGIIAPGHFLPLIEKTGFMKTLSEYITIKVIKQLATWNTLGFRKIQVAINLSMRDFEVTDYHTSLHTLLQKNNVDASQVKIEITENIAMANEKYSAEQFSKLKSLGIEISLDDFGTGYSSFSMLESFPIDTVKIDRSFIFDMTKNKDHYSIVKAMIAMAHTLGIKVIAEGIEDKKTALSLQKLDCDYMQGYYFGRPMAVFEFQELIRSDRQISKSGDIITLLSEE